MRDARSALLAHATIVQGKIPLWALLVGSESGSMDSLDPLLKQAGVLRVARAQEASELATHSYAEAGAVFVDSAIPSRVLTVAQIAHRHPQRPKVIAVGAPAGPRDMFEFGRGGVSSFLESPFDAAAVRACLDLHGMEAMRDLARSQVGRVGLREAQQELRYLMVTHALRLCHGSRCSAARLLGVTRPAIQRALREGPEELPKDGGVKLRARNPHRP